MAEKTTLTTEERLAKATECYKQVKAEYDAEVKENESLRAEIESLKKNAGDESLRARVKELEDEMTINGNSAEEIAKLNERLEKAKAIFAEQKAKIAELAAKLKETDTALLNTEENFKKFRFKVKDSLANITEELDTYGK